MNPQLKNVPSRIHEHPKPKFVLITGASSGIGEASALQLAKTGFQVFAGVRKEADGEHLSKLSNFKITPLLLDVTDSELISKSFCSVSEQVGQDGLWGLINNAGIPSAGPIEFMPLEIIRSQIEVNLLGVVAVTQAFLPLLRLAKGRIVNISSESGFIALPFGGAYAATKYALEAVTDALRVELRPWGIAVCLIEPGDVNTPIWEKTRAAIDQLETTLSQEALELYGPVLKLRDGMKPHGIPPEAVAIIVEKILKARKPKAHTIVGPDAIVLTTIRHLPVSLRDRIISSVLPKYGYPPNKSGK